MYMDDLDPESGDAMDAILSNAVGMLGTFLCWFVVFYSSHLILLCCGI